MNDLPLVRLSRDRQWAVCANVDCGERFARPLVHMAERRAVQIAGSDELLEVPLGEDQSVLRFLPGWVNKEGRHLEEGWLVPGGVWTMSEHVRARISKGEPPAFRRVNSSRTRNRSLSKTAIGFPALVICPACGLPQVVTQEVLVLR